jgi:hypothetical protein
VKELQAGEHGESYVAGRSAAGQRCPHFAT